MACLAVVVIGVLATWLSQPKRGSVEWHKREYRDARMRVLQREGLWQGVRAFCYRSLGKRVPTMTNAERQAVHKRIGEHEEALVRMGFLERRKVTNRTGAGLVVWMRLAGSKEAIDGYAYGRMMDRNRKVLMWPYVEHGSTSFIDGWFELSAPSNDLPKWEALARSWVQPDPLPAD
jgi:hypothetical protein